MITDNADGTFTVKLFERNPASGRLERKDQVVDASRFSQQGAGPGGVQPGSPKESDGGWVPYQKLVDSGVVAGWQVGQSHLLDRFELAVRSNLRLMRTAMKRQTLASPGHPGRRVLQLGVPGRLRRRTGAR